jgi:hypothetical protein
VRIIQCCEKEIWTIVGTYLQVSKRILTKATMNKADCQLPTVECNMLEGLVMSLMESGNM